MGFIKRNEMLESRNFLLKQANTFYINTGTKVGAKSSLDNENEKNITGAKKAKDTIAFGASCLLSAFIGIQIGYLVIDGIESYYKFVYDYPNKYSTIPDVGHLFINSSLIENGLSKDEKVHTITLANGYTVQALESQIYDFVYDEEMFVIDDVCYQKDGNNIICVLVDLIPAEPTFVLKGADLERNRINIQTMYLFDASTYSDELVPLTVDVDTTNSTIRCNVKVVGKYIVKGRSRNDLLGRYGYQKGLYILLKEKLKNI